jgi:hypothetical protein
VKAIDTGTGLSIRTSDGRVILAIILNTRDWIVPGGFGVSRKLQNGNCVALQL